MLFNPALIEVGLANVRVCVDSVKKTVLRIVFIPVLGTELEASFEVLINGWLLQDVDLSKGAEKQDVESRYS